MQLKLGIGIIDAMAPSTDNSANQYRILLLQQMGGTHDMGVFVILKASPVEKQSIGDVYAYRNLPASLTNFPA
jgi:hypothetical protein